MNDLSCDVKNLLKWGGRLLIKPILFYLDVHCVMKSFDEIPVSFPTFTRHNFENN